MEVEVTKDLVACRQYASSRCNRVPAGTKVVSSVSAKQDTADLTISRVVSTKELLYLSRGSVTGRFTQPRWNESISGSVRITMRSAKPVHGRLFVQSVVGGQGLQFSQCVAGGSVRLCLSPFETSITRTFPLKLDARGAVITHDCSMATGFGIAPFGNMSLSVRFVADTTFESYGNACGAQLVGKLDTQRNVQLTASSLYTTPGTSVLFFGARRTNTQFPGTSCFIYTDPLVLVPLSPNASGVATRTFQRPSGAFELSGQAFSMQSGRLIQLSNGLRVGVF